MDAVAEIINRALEELKARTGLVLKRTGNGAVASGLLLTLKAGKGNRQFAVHFKKHLNPQILGAVLQSLRTLPRKGLLVADYVNPHLAERLREMNVPFIDAVGNAFLNEPPIYVYIVGNKPKQRIAKVQAQPFHAAGMRLVFLLLCRPELANTTYRELAGYAGVALGTVGKVMEDLKVRKILLPAANGRQQMTNIKQLLQEWVMLYPTILRPKLVLGKYTAPKADWWKNASLPPEALWGGETAAAELTDYLKPALATIYTHGKAAPVIVRNHLREDANGSIEILRTFWDRGLQLNRKGTVPALLIYADLLATGNARNIETAGILYDKEIARRI